MAKEEKETFTFEKKNYLLMIAGIVVIALGFTFMSLDTEPYGFGALGLIVGPITLMVGFIIEFFAIFHKSKKSE